MRPFLHSSVLRLVQMLDGFQVSIPGSVSLLYYPPGPFLPNTPSYLALRNLSS